MSLFHILEILGPKHMTHSTSCVTEVLLDICFPLLVFLTNGSFANSLMLLSNILPPCDQSVPPQVCLAVLFNCRLLSAWRKIRKTWTPAAIRKFSNSRRQKWWILNWTTHSCVSASRWSRWGWLATVSLSEWGKLSPCLIYQAKGGLQ